MPRFDSGNPRGDKVSRYQDDIEDITTHSNKRRGFRVFSEFFKTRRVNSVIFPETILGKLEPIWDKDIEPVLVAEFGCRSTLHIIFYLGKRQDEIIMEIWDPNYVNTKPSQVFSITGVPDYATKLFAKSRSQAEISVLKDCELKY